MPYNSLMPKPGRPKWIPPKLRPYAGAGYLVRDHLINVGEDYIANMHRAYKEHLTEAEENSRLRGRPTVLYKRARYHAFLRRFLFYVQLGLVEPVRTEPAMYLQLTQERTYYRLTAKGMDPAADWGDPIRQLYPHWAGGLRKSKKKKAPPSAPEGPRRPVTPRPPPAIPPRPLRPLEPRRLF